MIIFHEVVLKIKATNKTNIINIKAFWQIGFANTNTRLLSDECCNDANEIKLQCLFNIYCHTLKVKER